MTLLLLFPDLGTPTGYNANDTYLYVSSTEPDLLDVYVDGSQVWRFSEA